MFIQGLGFDNTVSFFTVAVAVAFPNLELVISLVGAIFFSTLGLLVPALIDTVYRWDLDMGCCYYVLIKNLLIMFISIVALVAGSYASIAEMLHDTGNIVDSDTHHNSTLTR